MSSAGRSPLSSIVTRPETTEARATAAATGQTAATPPSIRSRRKAALRCTLPRMLKGYRSLWGASTRALLAAMVLATPAAAQTPDVEAAVHGLVLMNAFHTSDKTNNGDVPQFALPPDPAINPAASASGGTVRPSP